MNWWKGLKGKIRFSEPLKAHTTFGIGGPAEFFIEPKDIKDLKSLLSLRKRYKLPLLLMGAGSNILPSDKGVKGIVLRLSSPYFKQIVFRNNSVEAGSGVILSKMINLAKGRGLSGLEFMAGMPGTVAGALVMNAGISGRNIADLVEKVAVMDYNGNIRVRRKDEIKFGYRKSNLDKYIILSSALRLTKKNKKKIEEEILEHINRRRLTQDLSSPSAGCVFKNPGGDSAGRLIDLCGLKGKTIGRAAISKKHANFVINRGGAQAQDVLKLMDLAKRRVKRKFGIMLHPEIKIWQ